MTTLQTECREAYFAGDGSGLKSALVAYDDVRPYLIAFSGTWAPSKAILVNTIVPAAGLAAFGALFFIVAYVSFLRMDVRA